MNTSEQKQKIDEILKSWNVTKEQAYWKKWQKEGICGEFEWQAPKAPWGDAVGWIRKENGEVVEGVLIIETPEEIQAYRVGDEEANSSLKKGCGYLADSWQDFSRRVEGLARGEWIRDCTLEIELDEELEREVKKFGEVNAVIVEALTLKVNEARQEAKKVGEELKRRLNVGMIVYEGDYTGVWDAEWDGSGVPLGQLFDEHHAIWKLNRGENPSEWMIGIRRIEKKYEWRVYEGDLTKLKELREKEENLLNRRVLEEYSRATGVWLSHWYDETVTQNPYLKEFWVGAFEEKPRSPKLK